MAPLTFVAACALGACLVLVWPHASRPLRRAWRRAFHPRMVECCVCGGELPARRAVRIVDPLDDIDDGPTFGGGGAIIVEYHRRCAPKDAVTA